MFPPFDVAARQPVGYFEFNFLHSRCSFYLHDKTEQIAPTLEEINKRRQKKKKKLELISAKQCNAIKTERAVAYIMLVHSL